MEVDTGSLVSVICDTDYKNYFSDCTFNESELKLRSYIGDLIEFLGTIDVKVCT